MKQKEALQAFISFIIKDLRCSCGCSYQQSLNEPRACDFTHIVDIFEDELGIEVKEYPEAVKTFYEEYY